MKRTAATFVMLAGLGGLHSPDKDGPKPFGQASLGKEVPGVMGPANEPIHAAAQMPKTKDNGIRTADAKMPAGAKDSGVRQTAGFARVSSGPGVVTPGAFGGGCATGDCAGAGVGMGGPNPYGPMAHGLGMGMGHGGILPVPGMGPAGAVAAVGALGAPGSGMYGPIYANQRTSMKFVSPQGMDVSWQGPDGSFVSPAPITSPGVYNFPQGNIYRLRLSRIPTQPARSYYPTLEVYPATPKTVTFLSHNTVPLAITNEDLESVNAGNLVVKVVYLPDPAFQDLAALAGAEEIVSTRLDPGPNPVEEANRRGTILAVIRIGNIDLQNPATPAVDAPPGMVPGAPPPRMTSPPGGGSGGGTPPLAPPPPPKAPGALPPTLKTPPGTTPSRPVSTPAGK